jgi:UDP-glucose 4-epimerase
VKVLITGGAGFIARNLSEQLGNAHEISALNRQALDLLDAGQTLDCLKNNHFDVVIHTATYDAAPKHSTKDPTKVLENNLKMFFNLVRGKRHFGKMIYFGSGAEFDRPHWVPKAREDFFDRFVPADPYGFSKYLMTRYAQTNSQIVNLRLFGVFGKYDDWRTRFLPNACAHAVHDLDIRIDQNRYFDFLYIDDLVKVVHWFIDHQPAQSVYNLCTGEVFDFRTVAEKIVRISGKRLNVIVKNETPGQEYSGDNTLLMSTIPGLQFTPFDGALRDLYEWYDTNRQAVEKDKL